MVVYDKSGVTVVARLCTTVSARCSVSRKRISREVRSEERDSSRVVVDYRGNALVFTSQPLAEAA